MMSKDEWLSAFVTELVLRARSDLIQEGRFVRSVALQQWERLADENPKVVAQRWAARSGMSSDESAAPPTMLVWLSECGEELMRQQPALGHSMAHAVAHLQWDLHRDLSPVEAAMHWIASRPREQPLAA